MKKASIIIVVCLLFSIIVGLLLYFRSIRQYDVDRALDVIPGNSVALFFINSSEALANWEHINSDMVAQVKRLPFGADFIQSVSIVDSIRKLMATDNDAVAFRPSCHYFPVVSDSIRSSFCLEFASRSEAHYLNNLFRDKLFKLVTTSRSVLKKHDVYSLKGGDGVVWFLTIVDGRLIGSVDLAALEISVEQLNLPERLKHSESFARIRKTSASSAFANLYVQPLELCRYLGCSFNDQSLLSALANSGQWAGFDVELKGRQLVFSGVLISSAKSRRLKQLFDGIDPSQSTMAEVFPADTKFFISYQIAGQTSKLLSNLSVLDSTISESTQKLLSLIDGEIALVHAGGIDTVGVETFLVVKTSGQAEAISHLSVLSGDSVSSLTPVDYYKPDEGINIPIYSGFVNDEMQSAFIELFYNSPGHFFAFYDNYLVFANSKEAIVHFLKSNILGLTLNHQPGFTKFLDGFSRMQNSMIYLSPSYLPDLLSSHLKADVINQTLLNNGLNNFDAFAFQISAGSDPVYLNALLQYEPLQPVIPPTVWRRQLDAGVVGKPELVKNAKGLRDILVQDELHNLYLISNAGILKWKRVLGEPILGDINKVDCMNNGTTQFAFNTASRLYVIDQNGNNFNSFPVSFPSAAVNSMKVVNYGGGDDYRFFVVCKDCSVLAYNKKGNVDNEWGFNRTENVCVAPPQYFRVDNKDYLVFCDANRHYFLDRRGRSQFSLSTPLKQVGSIPFFMVSDKNREWLYTVAQSDQLAKVAIPSGVVSLIDVKLNSRPLAMNRIEGTEVQFAVIDSSSLYVVDDAGVIQWTTTPGESLNPFVDVYKFKSGIKIGVVGKNGHIFLYNLDGSLFDQFPLLGKSRFSVGKLSSRPELLNLIVGGAHGMLYNYPVDNETDNVL